MKVWILIASLLVCSSFSSDTDSLMISLQYQEDPAERIQTLFLLGRKQVVLPDSSAWSTLTEGIELAKELGEPEYEGKFYYLLGYYHHRKNQYSEAYINFSLAEQTLTEAKEMEYATKAGIFLARYAMETGDSDFAKAKYQFVAGKLMQHGLIANLGFVYEHLGYLYQDEQEHDKAAENFKLAHNYFLETEQFDLAIKSAYAVTENLLFEGELDEAELYLKKSIQILPNSPDTSLHAVRINFFHGRVAELRGDPVKAISWFQLSGEGGLKDFASIEYNFLRTNHIADYFLQQGLHQQALNLLVKQAQYVPEYPHDLALATLELLAKTYELMGDYQAALATERQFRQGVVAAQTAELQAQQARQASEVALAKLRLEMQDNQRAFQANQGQWLLGLLALALLGAAIWAWQWRITVRHRKKAEANATHWPELDRRMDALQRALNVLGEP
ncbi:MAG: hypothetical protein AAFQ98_06120 [Bacteroidota bacterium]